MEASPSSVTRDDLKPLTEPQPVALAVSVCVETAQKHVSADIEGFTATTFSSDRPFYIIGSASLGDVLVSYTQECGGIFIASVQWEGSIDRTPHSDAVQLGALIEPLRYDCVVSASLNSTQGGGYFFSMTFEEIGVGAMPDLSASSLYDRYFYITYCGDDVSPFRDDAICATTISTAIRNGRLCDAAYGERILNRVRAKPPSLSSVTWNGTSILVNEILMTSTNAQSRPISTVLAGLNDVRFGGERCTPSPRSQLLPEV